MLVLSRKVGEKIVLPEHGITISVVKVGKTKIQLGIVAPVNTAVHRSEVWLRVRGDKDTAGIL